MTDAQALVGRLVTIPRAAVRRLPPDRYYAFDLVEDVVETPEGVSLGTITEVVAGPEHDYWTVQRGDRAWSLPAVAALVATLIEVEGLSPEQRRVMGHGIVGMIEGASIHWLNTNSDADPGTLAHQLADLAWRGLRGVTP